MELSAFKTRLLASLNFELCYLPRRSWKPRDKHSQGREYISEGIGEVRLPQAKSCFVQMQSNPCLEAMMCRSGQGRTPLVGSGREKIMAFHFETLKPLLTPTEG